MPAKVVQPGRVISVVTFDCSVDRLLWNSSEWLLVWHGADESRTSVIIEWADLHKAAPNGSD
jgi:hypothetical protein